MFLGTASYIEFPVRGRATDWAAGFTAYQTPDKLRLPTDISWSEATGAMIRGREGNNAE